VASDGDMKSGGGARKRDETESLSLPLWMIKCWLTSKTTQVRRTQRDDYDECRLSACACFLWGDALKAFLAVHFVASFCVATIGSNQYLSRHKREALQNIDIDYNESCYD